jgi:hypothetical protein
MAVTVKNLGAAIVVALRDSTTIQSKCQEYFYKAHTVMYGSTGDKSPSVDEMPAFAVIPWGKDRGEDDRDRVFRFTIVLTMEDETVTSATSERGVDTKIYRGTDILEELLDLAHTAIRSMNTELFYNDLGWEFEPIEYFPLFVGQVIIEISYPVLIGQYEPSV